MPTGSDGTLISGRATRNVGRLTVCRDTDTISVDVDATHKSVSRVARGGYVAVMRQ